MPSNALLLPPPPCLHPRQKLLITLCFHLTSRASTYLLSPIMHGPQSCAAENTHHRFLSLMRSNTLSSIPSPVPPETAPSLFSLTYPFFKFSSLYAQDIQLSTLSQPYRLTGRLIQCKPLLHDQKLVDCDCTGPDGSPVPSQLIPVSNATWALQQVYVNHSLAHGSHAGDAEIAFISDIPPVGYSVYTLEPAQENSGGVATESRVYNFRWDRAGEYFQGGLEWDVCL